jgi:hypothetical protein
MMELEEEAPVLNVATSSTAVCVSFFDPSFYGQPAPT